MRRIRDLWQGELTLPDAFWNWAVLGGVTLNAASSMLFLFLVSLEHLLPAFIVGYAVTVPYNLLVTVGVWRSAKRYPGERRWADWARVATVIGMVLLSFT